jgi:hypothetical protein
MAGACSAVFCVAYGIEQSTSSAGMDPTAERFAKYPDWFKTFYDYDPQVRQGMPLHMTSNTPLEFYDGLRKVCSKKASEETSQVLQDTIYSDISLEHFHEALNCLKTDSAPGPSR